MHVSVVTTNLLQLSTKHAELHDPGVDPFSPGHPTPQHHNTCSGCTGPYYRSSRVQNAFVVIWVKWSARDCSPKSWWIVEYTLRGVNEVHIFFPSVFFKEGRLPLCPPPCSYAPDEHLDPTLSHPWPPPWLTSPASWPLHLTLCILKQWLCLSPLISKWPSPGRELQAVCLVCGQPFPFSSLLLFIQQFSTEQLHLRNKKKFF